MIELGVHFTAKLWANPGPGAWHFLTLPKQHAEPIKFFYQKQVGFGAISVVANIGKTEWKTALFPDKKSNSYLLPVKAAIRKMENIQVGDTVTVRLSLIA